MQLIPSQIAYSSTVSPQGGIQPAWQAFLEATVRYEDFQAWCKSTDTGIGLTIPREEKRFSVRKALAGLMP